MNRITTLPPLPDRPNEGHKGLFGRVLIVGGSESMIGAPILAGTAAMRMGSGLVQVAMPASVLAPALSITPELIGLPLSGTNAKPLLAAAEDADALVIGPGIGQSPAAKARVMKLLTLKKPAVIDADALNLLAKEKTWSKGFKLEAILTPHPGEMKRLGKFLKVMSVPTDDAGRADLAAAAAKTFGQIVVLKGHRTIITDGDRIYINRTGNSTLSKAGSGDVLSGMIASLIGQGMKPFDAAVAGVWMHGKAGEIAGQTVGRRSAMSRDVIDALAQAIADYQNHAG